MRLRRAGLSVLSLGVSLCLAELVARLAGAGDGRLRGPRSLENPEKTRAIDAYPAPPSGGYDLDLRDPATVAALARQAVPEVARAARNTPYAVGFAYNPERCRNAPVGPRTPGVARVMFLGDSFTEGQGVLESQTFSRGVERALRAAGRPVEVINCGRRGSDFPFLYERFEGLTARYAPDVVVYAMVLNDAAQSAEFHARQAFLNDWILDRRRMLGDDDPGARSPLRSRLWDFVTDRVHAIEVGRATTRWYLDMYGPPNAAGWSQTRAYLRRMEASQRARGGRFAVALLPLLVRTDGGYPFAPVTRTVASACADAGIPFTDLLPAVAGTPAPSLWVHPLDMHPNAAAHARFAARLVPVVQALLPPTP